MQVPLIAVTHERKSAQAFSLKAVDSEINRRLVEEVCISSGLEYERPTNNNPQSSTDFGRSHLRVTAHNDEMTSPTREEIDAKLDAAKADARASIAESSKETIAAIGQTNTQLASLEGHMLAEMQGLRADFATMLKDVTKEMADARVAAAEVRGSLDGLKSSISMFQWVIGVAVAVVAIGVAWLQLDLAKQAPTSPNVEQPAEVATQTSQSPQAAKPSAKSQK